jgi:hypothetical protein
LPMSQWQTIIYRYLALGSFLLFLGLSWNGLWFVFLSHHISRSSSRLTDLRFFSSKALIVSRLGVFNSRGNVPRRATCFKKNALHLMLSYLLRQILLLLLS